jgi:hypothetical protein
LCEYTYFGQLKIPAATRRISPTPRLEVDIGVENLELELDPSNPSFWMSKVLILEFIFNVERHSTQLNWVSHNTDPICSVFSGIRFSSSCAWHRCCCLPPPLPVSWAPQRCPLAPLHERAKHYHHCAAEPHAATSLPSASEPSSPPLRHPANAPPLPLYLILYTNYRSVGPTRHSLSPLFTFHRPSHSSSLSSHRASPPRRFARSSVTIHSSASPPPSLRVNVATPSAYTPPPRNHSLKDQTGDQRGGGVNGSW